MSSSSESSTKPDHSNDVVVYNIDVNQHVRSSKWKAERKKFHKKYSEKDNLVKAREQRWKQEVKKKAKQKYGRGSGMDMDGLGKYHAKHFTKKEVKYKKAAELGARSELLLPEQAGFLEAEDGEETYNITQHAIANFGSVDITSASKFFELHLNDFGPYTMNYTRNGRHLLLAGKKGHVAAIDWQTKKLMCEMNVMESVNDVKWLHLETMFAVAQRKWVHIYDNQAIELHCVKVLDSVLRMEFLPYHFLLATANSKSYLSWLDVSVGKQVAGHVTKLGRLDVMCQNPHNAIIHLGHSRGRVSLWSPNVKEPLVKMLCHNSAVRGVAVDSTGQYMATSAVDRSLKIWDTRQYKLLQSYKLGACASSLSFSQRGLLASAIGNVVEVYQDCCLKTVDSPYMVHKQRSSVCNLQFCPHEDVLGVGHAAGFTSLIIPGAGEPNFDGFESNPYQTKSQRKEFEVKALLEKVQPELITLDPTQLGDVDYESLRETIEERNKLIFLKPQKIEVNPRKKTKGRGSSKKTLQRKKGMEWQKKQETIKEIIKLREEHEASKKKSKSVKKHNDALSRFKSKTNTA